MLPHRTGRQVLPGGANSKQPGERLLISPNQRAVPSWAEGNEDDLKGPEEQLNCRSCLVPPSISTLPAGASRPSTGQKFASQAQFESRARSSRGHRVLHGRPPNLMFWAEERKIYRQMNSSTLSPAPPLPPSSGPESQKKNCGGGTEGSTAPSRASGDDQAELKQQLVHACREGANRPRNPDATTSRRETLVDD